MTGASEQTGRGNPADHRHGPSGMIRTLLVFDLDGMRFGLDATLMRESVWLPELTPVEEAPHYIAGIFSLRGRIVPVSDLGLRFGHQPRPYRLTDQLVVLEAGNRLAGIIVSEVIEVTEVPLDAIQAPPEFEGEIHSRMIEGEVRVGEAIVTLLDSEQLARLSLDAGQLSPSGLFQPDASPEERAVFHARALALMEDADETDGDRLPIAVVELGGEHFGIELDAVEEFCEIAQPGPIPCCPPHILGAISLRGNLFTLLDVRSALNLPGSTQAGGKVVIARMGDQAVGMDVDDVCDVIYLQREVLQSAPEVLREQRGASIKGAAPYRGRIMAVLDLPALLAREEWIVNERVQ